MPPVSLRPRPTRPTNYPREARCSQQPAPCCGFPESTLVCVARVWPVHPGRDFWWQATSAPCPPPKLQYFLNRSQVPASLKRAVAGLAAIRHFPRKPQILHWLKT